MTCGLYHKESDGHFLSLDHFHQGPYYSDEGFSMPLPNESVFSSQTDFDLSHDLFYLIDISGGAKDVRLWYSILSNRLELLLFVGSSQSYRGSP